MGVEHSLSCKKQDHDIYLKQSSIGLRENPTAALQVDHLHICFHLIPVTGSFLCPPAA